MSNVLEAIRASAGSGKTYALTTRYLSLLQQGEKPDGILATTFTRKAAGEILGRVLRRLAEAAEHDAKSGALAADLGITGLSREQFRGQLVELCRSLHRVSISTLDSFFGRLSGSFRHELGTPADANLLAADAPQAVQIRLEAIRAVLAEDPTESWVALLDQLHQGTAQRSVTQTLDDLISNLYEIYRQAPAEAWYRLAGTPGPDDEAVAAAVALLRELAPTAPDKRMTKAIDADCERAQAGDWGTFLEKGLAPKVQDDLPYYQKPIPPEIARAYQLLLARARAELIGRIAEQTAATHRLLERFDRHYTELRRRRRALLFSDVPLALAQVMPERSLQEIAYRIDVRIEHLLLDEFQDTSPEQWRILRPFAFRIGEASESGSLFCVGDMKQAIYGWRGGCAEIFHQLDCDLAGLTWRSTERVYRSSQVVLDVVNRVFGSLRTNAALEKDRLDALYWAAVYADHVAMREHLTGYVELATSPSSGTDEEETDDAVGDHLAFAADRIAELARRRPGASVGVLMRTNDGVCRLLYHLQRREIPASGEGGSPVDDDSAVEAILAALTLADHPGDTAAAFQVRHSPLGMVLGLEGSEPAAVARVASRVRRELLSEGYAATIATWARQVAPDCDARGAHRLTQLVELADAFDPTAGLRPTDFVRYARATAVEEPTPARVRVMTVHRSKGLEFDIVVLPELHGRIAGRPPVLLIDRPSPTAPIHAVYRTAPASVRKLEPALEEAHRGQRSAEVRESLCLLYVALTRARHALHLFLPAIGRTPKGEPRAERFSHAAILRAALRDREENPDGGETLFTYGDPDWQLDAPLAPSAPAGAPPGPVVLAKGGPRRNGRVIRPSELEAGGRVQAERILAVEEAEPLRRGRLLHAWLERLTWSDDPPPEEEELVRYGFRVMEDATEEWCREALPEFRAMREGELLRAVLAKPDWPRTPDLWRERPFVVRTEEGLVRGAFDRVVVLRDEAGQAVQAELIDFKTDRCGPEEVSALVEIYRPQMSAYRSALMALLGLPLEAVRSRLLFTTAGYAVDVV